MTREPEFDAEQHALLAALEEHERGLNQYGIPLDEATSPDADPDNPHAKFHYDVRVLRDFSASAVEAREQEFKEHPSRARIFAPVRVDH
ncbi:hypothetical protein [Microbacterium sp. KNMS]